MRNDPNENKPGYQQTKIGWIPEEWECASLASFGSFLKGAGISKDELCETGILAVRYGDLYTTHDIVVRNFVSFVDEKTSRQATPLRFGDIVFASSGETAKEIGKLAAILTKVSCVAGGDTIIFRPRSGDPYFLAAMLNSGSSRRYLARSGQGQSVVHIYRGDLEQLEVAFPMLLEQRLVAERLVICDEAIEKTSKLIDAKRLQKKALMQQLLAGKKRLRGFEGEWVHRKMSSMLTHVFRPVEWAGDKMFNLVSVKRRSMGLFRRMPLRGDQYKTRDLHELKAGDFLVSKRQVTHGALAMVALQFDGCHVSKEYSIFVNKAPKQLHMPFFDWLSRTRRMWWLAYVASNGVVIEKLIFVPEDFLKFEIRLPPTAEEQAAISNVLDSCEAELVALDKKIAALQRQKKALMQKLLTGQVRVKV